MVNINEEKLAVRKDFLFLLNYAVNILKREHIEGDDLVLFSIEVERFKKNLINTELPRAITDDFQNIEFNYSYTRKDASDFIYLFLKRLFADWAQQKNRYFLLQNFLKKYDGLLNLLDNNNKLL